MGRLHIADESGDTTLSQLVIRWSSTVLSNCRTVDIVDRASAAISGADTRSIRQSSARLFCNLLGADLWAFYKAESCRGGAAGRALIADVLSTLLDHRWRNLTGYRWLLIGGTKRCLLPTAIDYMGNHRAWLASLVELRSFCNFRAVRRSSNQIYALLEDSGRPASGCCLVFSPTHSRPLVIAPATRVLLREHPDSQAALIVSGDSQYLKFSRSGSNVARAVKAAFKAGSEIWPGASPLWVDAGQTLLEQRSITVSRLYNKMSRRGVLCGETVATTVAELSDAMRLASDEVSDLGHLLRWQRDVYYLLEELENGWCRYAEAQYQEEAQGSRASPEDTGNGGQRGTEERDSGD